MNQTILRLSRSLPFAAAVLLIVPAAWAHHSFVATFDATQTLTAHGTVREFQWSNPHSSVNLVTDDLKQLNLEMNGPIGLKQAGWSQDTLKPGDKITVVYHPLRDGGSAEWGQLVAVQTADGTKLRWFGVPGAAAAAQGQAPAQGAGGLTAVR